MNQQQLVAKALRDIVDGRAASQQAPESTRRRAQELLEELERRQQRPGVLSEAASVAEEFFLAAGRLRRGEKLLGDMSVPVKLTDGREVSVAVPRHQTVSQLRDRIASQTGSGAGVGLMVSGRPLADTELLYDLWQRDSLGCSGSATRVTVQVTVRNVGG